MRPIRAERSREVATDPWTGGKQQLGQSDTIHVLTDGGAIESHRTTHCHARGCGCFNSPGGVCAVCGCTTYTETFDYSKGPPLTDHPMISVNSRLFDDFDLDAVEHLVIDGKNLW